jgi:glycosyltransferase involved in cell wall biosynthesis
VQLDAECTVKIPISLFVVIVLYKVAPESSASFRSLCEAMKRIPQETTRIRVLLYDNTPNARHPAGLPEFADYIHSPANRGIAEAYNNALETASHDKFDWLLTLDQDTELAGSFLKELFDVIARVAPCSEIAAIVPQIVERGRLLSPEYFLLDAFPRYFPKGFQGISKRDTFAFNSASTLRVSSLREIGGYDPLFWLDFSDACMYSRLHKSRKKVYIAGNIQVQHQFSMRDKKHRVTVERYQNIVNALSALCDLELGSLAGLWFTVGLSLRVVKHWIRGDERSIRRVTFRMLVKRITQSRGRRIAEWEAAKGYCPELPQEFHTEMATGDRERVSICMAAYNGERYIELQIRSILNQLREYDELIIVDDASTDATRDCVRHIGDPRIRLIESKENRGVLASFEQAIQEASGSVIFLSDQDDIWDPEKISTVMRAFHQNRKVRVVLTATCPIDDQGRQLGDASEKKGRGFSDGFLSNLIRNKYQGCTMAFRSTLRPEILPFPVGHDVLHDIWIGSRNKLSGGVTVFIDRPLVRYRRHARNVTGNSKLSRWRQLRVRFDLIRALISFELQKGNVAKAS